MSAKQKSELSKTKVECDGELNSDVPSPLKLWTKSRTAKVLHVKIKTLENWRLKGVGPPFLRLGGPHGRVFYREIDLRNYIECAVRRSTSDTGIQDPYQA